MAKHNRLHYKLMRNGYAIHTLAKKNLYVLSKYETKEIVHVLPPDHRGIPTLLTEEEIFAFIDKRNGNGGTNNE